MIQDLGDYHPGCGQHVMVNVVCGRFIIIIWPEASSAVFCMALSPKELSHYLVQLDNYHATLNFWIDR